MRLRFSIVALSFFLCIQMAEGQRLPVVNIGIVMDGYADLRQRARDLLEPELIELMGGDYDVRIPEDKLVQGDGTIESVRQLIAEQLVDPSITMVVAAGSIASHVVASELGNRGELAKATIAPFVINADVQRLPRRGETSGVRSLNYIAFPSDVRSDLKEFRNAVPFDRVAIVLNRYVTAAIPGLEAFYLEAAAELGTPTTKGPRSTAASRILSGAAARLFAINRFDARATVGWLSHAGPLWLYSKGLTLEGHVGFSRRDFNQQFGPEGPLVGIKGSTAAANTLAGLGTDLSMVSFGAAITWDDRDFEAPQKSISHPLIYQFPGRMLRAQGGVFHSYRDITFPEGGGLVLAEFDYVSGSDDVKFTRLIAEVQRFHTLFWSNRILAARLRLEKVSGVSDGFVPYTDLPTLGGSQRLRGYERGAFRGEGALLFALEYRYPVWDTWNAFLSYEEGQVFDEYGDIDLGELNSSVAAGLSMRTARAFLMSVRIAHSEDENALIGFAMEQEF